MYLGTYGTLEAGKQAIFERVSAVSSTIMVACFKYAVVKTDDGFRLAYARIVFSDNLPDEDVTYEYDRLILSKQWISIEQARTVISQLLGNNWTVNGNKVSEDYQGLQENVTLPVANSVTGWKEHVFTVSAYPKSRIDYKSYPLVAFSYPAFDSDLRAIAEWIFGDPGREQYIRNGEKLEIIVPDKKVRIARAHWAGSGIDVRLEGLHSSANMALKTIEIEGKKRVRHDHKVSSDAGMMSVLSLPFSMEKVARVELYLVDESNDLLDSAELKNSGVDYETPDGELTLSDLVEADLESGENEFIEFKPWIQRNDPKENEILKTIVAFANSGGGRLYLGVKNDGSVQKGSSLRKAFNGNETDPLKRAQDRITTLVRENLEPVPEVNIIETEYAGEPIVVVEVAEGADPPYATHSHDIYIRRGATNRKPAPSEELLNLFIKGNKVQRG